MKYASLKAACHFSLALWVLVTNCSFGLCHKHERGEDRHCHGLGWTTASDLFGHENLVDNSISHSVWHCHVVFFGWETHLVPEQNSLFSLGQGVPLATGQYFFLTQLLEQQHEFRDLPKGCSFPDLFDQAPETFLAGLSCLAMPGNWLLSSSPFSAAVCAFALGLCAGVQRI